MKKHCVSAGVIKLLCVASINCGLESAFSIWESRTRTPQTGANERIANVGTGADNFSTFLASRNGSGGGQSDWPAPGDIVLWPSYFCFAVALISVVFGTIVVIAYYWGTDAANKWNDRHGTFIKVAFLVKLTLSAAVAGSMYSTSSATTPSIWGISCNVEPQTMSQKNGDYGQLCTIQVHAFASMVLILVEADVFALNHLRFLGGFDRLDIYTWFTQHETEEKDRKA